MSEVPSSVLIPRVIGFDRCAPSSDDHLTKTHVRFLESRIIQAIADAASVTLANSTAPNFQRIPEAHRADMEFFLDQLRLVLPILGFDLLRRPGLPDTAAAAGGSHETTFTFSTAGASAIARETDDGFVVLAGSTARLTPSGTFPAGYLEHRDRLVAEGKLVAGPTPDPARASPRTWCSPVRAPRHRPWRRAAPAAHESGRSRGSGRCKRIGGRPCWSNAEAAVSGG